MQRYRARQRISGQVQNCFENRAGFVPVTDVVAIVFTHEAERSRISRIHKVSARVQLVSDNIAAVVLGHQSQLHCALNQRALAWLENWRRRYGSNFDAEFL